ncbi:CinA family protein [Limnohabitans sp. G3-2]|uniref:CinA family protein n=1 Tax=Limnohabitans sp. G3-2 TaxID=1100711 RepID=UPI000C1E5376|nr:CinA family protein [Limnohabitans sp. G3-2]PIT72113.1 damage-inducible protein CinA [Limnohabitans sp. G3-2]
MTDISHRLAERLLSLQWQMATAESCTGGLISACCTDLAGSSAWFDRGFVTYSNDAKTHMLGVPPDMISAHGAVSEPVAHAMAMGAVYRSKAQASVAVTGVAGPSGGSAEKPVGTVWFGWCIQGLVATEIQHFGGDRQAIRQATALHALEGLLKRLPHLS